MWLYPLLTAIMKYIYQQLLLTFQHESEGIIFLDFNAGPVSADWNVNIGISPIKKVPQYDRIGGRVIAR